MAKGFFIAIEGPDGCGKSTQINYLSENLRCRMSHYRK